MISRNNKFGNAVFFVLLAALCTVSPAGAQEAPEKDTIHFSSERLEIDNNSKTAVLSGNVKVSQGTTVIRSQKLRLRFGETDSPAEQESGYAGDAEETGDPLPVGGDVREIVAMGDVRIEFDEALAEADEAVYDVRKRILTLSGKSARVINNQNVISGSRIIVDRNSGLTKVEGSVEGVYFPEKEKGIE